MLVLLFRREGREGLSLLKLCNASVVFLAKKRRANAKTSSVENCRDFEQAGNEINEYSLSFCLFTTCLFLFSGYYNNKIFSYSEIAYLHRSSLGELEEITLGDPTFALGLVHSAYYYSTPSACLVIDSS